MSRTPGASPEEVVSSLLVGLLLTRELTFDSKSATRLVRAASRPGFLRSQNLLHLMDLVETVPQPFDNELKGALNVLRALASQMLRPDLFQKLSMRVEPALGAQPLKPGGPFTEVVFENVRALPKAEAAAWEEVFKTALLNTGARPTQKWVEQMRTALSKLDPESFVTQTRLWLQLGPTPGGIRGAFVPELDAAYLRGLIFGIGVAQANALASDVGALALACYRKIPSRGPVSLAAGNACLWTLGELGLDGVGQLGRLKTRVKYSVALRLIEKALDDAARRAGVDAEDLEEIGVPTCELDENARYEQKLSEVTARIEVKGDACVSLAFVTASGKVQKSPPGELKGAAELKALKARVKEIDAMLHAQRARLERLFLGDRVWPFSTWSSRYLNHPLMQNLARRLVWQVFGGGTFTFADGRLVNAKGEPMVLKPSDPIRLWHPLDAADEGWASREDVQPFKQVGRDVYALSPHEVEQAFTTRFAGKRLQQNRFAAQCRERNWHYTMQGEFDGGENAAWRVLPEWKLRVELDVAAPRSSGTSYTGLFLEIETGDVHFTVEGEMPPSRVLSELLRDVAQFVR